MPFEISPKIEAPAKAGRFQHLADALLRGCAMTRPAIFGFYNEGALPWMKPLACAMGAMKLGLGEDMDSGWAQRPEVDLMKDAYFCRYHTFPETDNDHRFYTREQIAARIAAL